MPSVTAPPGWTRGIPPQQVLGPGRCRCCSNGCRPRYFSQRWFRHWEESALMSSSCVIMLSFYFPEELALSLSSDTIPGRIKLVRTRRWNWNRRSSQLSLVFGTLCCRPRQAAALMLRFAATPYLYAYSLRSLPLFAFACLLRHDCVHSLACRVPGRTRFTYLPEGPNLAIKIVAFK